MSKQVTAPPLLPPAQADKLLEELVYERVVECIDFDALYQFEQELWCALGDLVAPDEVAEVAAEMVGRALVRTREDERRWITFADSGTSSVLDDDCELCREVAEAEKVQRKRPEAPVKRAASS